MNRRPILLLLLAFLFGISPFIYPLFVAIYFGTSFSTVLSGTLAANSSVRNFEIFLLPILLGMFTYFARRSSYYVVIIGSIYLAVRNSFLFIASTDATPVSGVMALNVLFVSGIIYLSRRDTREIYFNPRMRWWETDPRYVVEWNATLTREGGKPEPIRLRNIAVGGAAVESFESDFKPHEPVKIEFVHDDRPFRLSANVVWEQPWNGPGNYIGLQWVKGEPNVDPQKVPTLIRELKAKGTPTNKGFSRWQEFKAWL